MKKLNYERTLLYDGFEEGLFEQTFTISIADERITLDAELISNNRLAALKEHLAIVKNPTFSEEISSIKSEDRLPLYFFNTKALLLIVSMGESQPMRYKFYIEQVWLL